MRLKLIKVAIPALMLFFFARNIYLVQSSGLDSWMGGGMRMFGKIDKMLYRVAGFKATYNSKTYFINLRSIPEFEDEDIALRILPSDDRLNKILKKVKNNKWYFNPEKESITLKPTGVNSVLIDNSLITKVEVLTVDFNSSTKELKLKDVNYAQ